MRQTKTGLNFGTMRFHDANVGGGTVDPLTANMYARRACIQQGVNEWQQIAQQNYVGVNANTIGQVWTVPIRNVGLVKRLLVRVSAQVQANGQTLTPGPFGPAQIFSNVQFTDLSNQVRINTAGWHLFTVASAKRRLLYGAAYTTDTPCGFGSNYPAVMAAPASITTNPAVNNVFCEFEIPLAYTDQDLRGAVYMNVTSANAYLQLTINPNFFVNSTADPTLAVYKSSSATLGLLPSITIQVYQNYLDQLPVAQNGGPVLPLLDLSTAYLMNVSPIAANVNNQDIPIAYANFRDFLSTSIILNNGGTLNPGTDVTYWALQSANYTNIFKYDAQTAAFMARLVLGDDPPVGMYYFESRDKPISTIQYGNMQMILNGSGLAATAAMYVGFEQMALINQVTQAGSLYGTG